MDIVTSFTIGLALLFAVPVALVVVGWLMSIATRSNRMAARWAFFCEVK